MENVVAAFNALAARYTEARAALRAAKKGHGKKSPEVKAARKTVRAIKKERAAFMAANPGFVTPPKARKERTHGMVRKEPEPKVDNTKGETVMTYTPNGGFKTPDGKAVDPFVEVPADPVVEQCTRGVSADNIAPPWSAVTPAPSAVPSEAKVIKGTLSAAILNILKMAAEPLSPAQVATLVKTAGEGNINAKQAADALARLAKTGKCRKVAAGSYAAA